MVGHRNSITKALIASALLVGLSASLCLMVVVARLYRMRHLSLAQLSSSSSNILLSPAHSARSSR